MHPSKVLEIRRLKTALRRRGSENWMSSTPGLRLRPRIPTGQRLWSVLKTGSRCWPGMGRQGSHLAAAVLGVCEEG